MTLSDRLIAAIHDGTLAADVASLTPIAAGDRALVDAAAAALAAIGADGVSAYRALAEGFAEAGVAYTPLAEPGAMAQRIALDLSVSEPDAGAAVAAAEALGYRPWYRLSGGAWEAYRRWYPSLPLVAETAAGHPILLQIQWRAPVDLSGWRARVRPVPSDLERLALPGWLWVGHVVLRPVRMVTSRLLGRTSPVEFGPFLPTPTGLIDALLDVAEVGPDDVVADLGCGDGRVLVHAARTRGCRAIGVDRDGELVARAAAAATAAGVGSLVNAVVGEIETFDVSEASVVVLFLSAAGLPDIVEGLRGRLRPGARIVAHEQAPVSLRADRAVPLFAPAGITVAHRWDVA